MLESYKYKDLIQIICTLAELKNTRVTITKSENGALVVGACAFFGGLLGGARGTAIGGVAGSLLAYGMYNGDFVSLRDAIMKDLSETQRKQLVEHICKTFNCMDINKMIKLLANKSVQEAVLSAATTFVISKLQGVTVNK